MLTIISKGKKITIYLPTQALCCVKIKKMATRAKTIVHRFIATVMLGLLLFAVAVVVVPLKAEAAGEQYRWTGKTVIAVSGGRIDPASYTINGNVPLIGLSGIVEDISGCLANLVISNVSADHSTATVTANTNGISPSDTRGPACAVGILNQYDKSITITNTEVWGSTTPPLGCPGGPAGPVPGNANYPCPGGGAVVNGTYFSHPGLVGRIQGRVTFKYEGVTGNCKNSTVSVTRTQSGTPTAPGDTSANTAVTGEFVMANVATGPGQVILVMDQCHAEDGTTYKGRSAPITVQANGIVDGSFEVTEIVIQADDDWCTSTDSAELSWLMCPVISVGANFIEKLDCQILSLIKINTVNIFHTGGVATGPVCGQQDTANQPDAQSEKSSEAYHKIWAAFRNIALAILVIIGLIMIASQIIGLDMFDAYTIRKMLPKLIIATIFMTLSWDIMEFVYNAANASADAVLTIIKIPFQNFGDANIGQTDFAFHEFLFTNPISVILLGTSVAGAGALAIIAFLGPGGLLALVASFALTILSVWVLLVGRDVVATLLVVFAPLAIMCSAYEPFEKLFKFWKTILIALLISIPAIAMVLAVSQAAALIAIINDNEFVGLIIIIAGFGLLWTIVLQLDKATGFFGNAMSKVTGRAQKALSDYRSNTAKNRFRQAVAGERNLLGEKYGWQRGLSNVATNLSRRAALSNQPGAAAFGKKFKAAEQNLIQQTALKKAADEGGRWTGDDDLMAILSDTEGDGRSRDTALAAYTKVAQGRALESAALANGYTKADGTADTSRLSQGQRTAALAKGRQDAIDGIYGAQASLGAPIGSKLMSSAAYKAKVGSVSAYNGDEFDKLQTEEGVKRMYQQLMQDIVPKVANGTMSITDAVNAIKKNSQRMDLAGHSFPQMMAQIAVSLERYKQGARGAGLITDSEIEKWRDGSIEYSQAGAQIAGRTETVKVQAQQELKRIGVAQSKVDAARAKLDPRVVRYADQTSAAYSAAQEKASKAITEDERRTARDEMDQARQEAVRGQQLLEAQPAYQEVQTAQDEVDRQLASFSVKHDQMGYASAENRKWYEKLLLGANIPGQAPGTSVMKKMEQRRGSLTFQRFHKEFQSSYAASTQAYMAQQAQQQAMQAQQAGLAPGAGGLPGGGQFGGPGGSDRWLKQDIALVGTALDGKVNLYRFKYLGDTQDYVGVMAQELLTTHPEVVFKAPDGFYRVDYAKLGVPFLTYEEWKKRQTSRVKSL